MLKEFNSHKIFFGTQTWPPIHCFVHKYGRRFIVLYTNMAAVASCENDLLRGNPRDQGKCPLNRGVPGMEIALGFVSN